MKQRTYTLADAYFALEGRAPLPAIAFVLQQDLVTPQFLEALARRLAPLAHGDDCEFELVLVKRKNSQPVDAQKRAIDESRRIFVRQRMFEARANGEDIESVTKELEKQTGRKRSWILKVAS